MKVVILDYGAGNIQSVKFAFNRLGIHPILTKDPTIIASADKVIFPGVGQASTAMEQLKASNLDTLIPELKQPLLGICLGMQLLCNHTEESDTKGLGIFNTNVLRFDDNKVKVPQIGWNSINSLKGTLFNGIKEDEYMYLVHSYYAETCNETIAEAQYGITYAAALQHNNFYGVQFHPEKSSNQGARILENFLNI